MNDTFTMIRKTVHFGDVYSCEHCVNEIDHAIMETLEERREPGFLGCDYCGGAKMEDAR